MPANAHFTNPYRHQTRFTRFKLGLDDSVEAKAQRTVAGHFALCLSGLAERNLENIGSTDASDRRSQMLDRMPFIRDNIAIRR